MRSWSIRVGARPRRPFPKLVILGLLGACPAAVLSAAEPSPWLNALRNGGFEGYEGDPVDTWAMRALDHWVGLDTSGFAAGGEVLSLDPLSLPVTATQEVWASKGLAATEGVHKLELDIYSGKVDALYQAFESRAGVDYVLTLDAYARADGSSDIEVWIDGAYVTTLTPPNEASGWATFEVPFLGAGGEQTLMLREVPAQNDGQGAILDNLRILGSAVDPALGLAAGEVAVGDVPVAIALDPAVVEPVVILSVPTDWDPEPGVVAVDAADPWRPLLQFREWGYLDGLHGAEDLSWLSMEAGHHVLPDGVVLEAGRVEVSGTFETVGRQAVGFQSPFPAAPAVFLTVQSVNEADPVTLRADNVSATGFEVIVQEEEALTADGHGSETVGYLAVYSPEPAFDLAGVPAELARIDVTDTATDTLGHPLWFEEEQSATAGTAHGSEGVDLLLLDGRHLFGQNVTFSGKDPGALRKGPPALEINLFGPTASAIGQTEVTLSWTAGGADSALIAGFVVLIDGAWGPQTTATTLSVDGLSPDTPYALQIAAVDAGGATLATSDVLNIVTETAAEPPQAPSSVSLLAADDTSITLGWTAPSGGTDAYRVYRDGVLIAETAALSHVDAGLSPATGYGYEVTAVRDGLESGTGVGLTASTIAAPDQEPPAAPAMLQAAQIGADGVTLLWSAVDDADLAGYRILRDGVEIADATQTTYEDLSVVEAASYSYTVRAVDTAGNLSAPSPVLTVTVPDATAPSTPDGLAAHASETAIHVEWSAATDAVGVAGYRLWRDGVLIATVAVPGHVDTTARVGVAHGYQVEAFDAAGNSSAPSSPVTAQIAAQPVLPSAVAETCVGCHGSDGISLGESIPTIAGMYSADFQAVMQAYADGSRHGTIMGRIVPALDGQEISLLGDYFEGMAFAPAAQAFDPAAAERGLALHRAHCAGCHGDTGSERINGILGGQWQAHLSATLDDVAAGLSYDVPQAMTDAVTGLSAGQRADLLAYYASLGADSDAPSAPTDLAIAARTEYSLTLTWLDADDGWPIDHYQIIRDGFVVAEVADTVYTDSGLAPDQVYNYQVIAVDTAGNLSYPSIGIAARTLGEPAVTDPSVSAGRDLWDGNNCGSCHVSASHLQEQLAAKGLGFTEAFNAAITSNAGGMGTLFGGMSAQDIADIEAYLAAAETPDASLEGIRLLDNQGLLRKAAILLAGRLPTQAEIDQAGDEAGLRTALRGLMQGERFAELVRDTARRQFLGAGADLDGSALRADFPVLADWRENDYSEYDAAKDDLRREPEELVLYLAEHDLPFAQVLTADFTMVNRRLAAALGAELLAPFTGPEDDQDEWVPARVPSLSARTDALAASPYPHAGVLSTRAWLTRFPTTDTNRNRHRAKMALMQFLGFDIEALGQRPVDDSANGDYQVPTMENPNCVLCHDIMEPVAGGFMDWSDEGSYRPVDGEHALASDYTGADYARDHAGAPWYDLGDNWYRDMFDPGHAGKSMPGAHFGFGDWDQAWRILDRSGWSVVEQPAYSAADSLEQAFDGDPTTIYHSAYADGDVPMPHVFTVDMGESREIEAVRYLPRQRTSAQWHIADYELQLSDDGATWQTVASGNLVGATQSIDAKLIRFAPQTARFFRLIAKSQEPNADTRQLSVIAELDVLAANAPGTVPYAEDANGADSATGWLGRELADDPRFATGAVGFWYRGLFGRAPLAAPVDENAPGYAQALAAYQSQAQVFSAVADAFAASGYKVRDLLLELVMSDLFRAAGSDGALSSGQAEALDQVPAGRLLDTAALNAKAQATLGRPLFDRVYTGDGLDYGGFDGGDATTAGHTEITPTMLSIYEGNLYEQLCDGRVLRDDLDLAPEARALLVHADDLIAPVVLDIPERQPDEAVEQLVFEGLGGNEIATLEGAAGYPARPTRVAFLTALDATPELGDNYGQRLRAILVPPVDGEYRFWVAADDQASLRLSADAGAEGLTEIASVATWTSRYQWDRDASQQSAPITLQAGQRYLIEVLHKEGGGGDHVAVAWSGPGIARTVVGAGYLEPAPLSVDAEASVNAIRQNLVHLHERLLGERLDPADPEIERTFQLFKAVYDNAEPADPALSEPYCENRNGATPARRAWNAVLAYLSSDFDYLNH